MRAPAPEKPICQVAENLFYRGIRAASMSTVSPLLRQTRARGDRPDHGPLAPHSCTGVGQALPRAV